MAGGFIPHPRPATAIERDFHRACQLRAGALDRLQDHIVFNAEQHINDLLDEYLRSRPPFAQPVHNAANRP